MFGKCFVFLPDAYTNPEKTEARIQEGLIGQAQDTEVWFWYAHLTEKKSDLMRKSAEKFGKVTVHVDGVIAGYFNLYLK